MATAQSVSKACVRAITNNVLIEAVSATDKEFHFQNWFEARLQECAVQFDQVRRNSYPDFRLVNEPIGFETKGLAVPGRDRSYDCNSQTPSGSHNGRTIYYVFGRYPKDLAQYVDPKDGKRRYPVVDLVRCHGDFLNVDNTYVHKNRNVKGFGSYGDIMIRDRKMYVAPTPFALLSGSVGTRTLVLPSNATPESDLVEVGRLVRVEAPNLVAGYSFDLQNNTIEPKLIPNPAAGKRHEFTAFRMVGDPQTPISLPTSLPTLDDHDDDGEDEP